jgi:hypothetical protein
VAKASTPPPKKRTVQDITAGLDAEGRKLMAMAKAIHEIQERFALKNAQVAVLLGIKPVDVEYYKKLRHLVPEVAENADQLGLWVAANLSIVLPARQPELASAVLDGSLTTGELPARCLALRDISRRPLSVPKQTLKQN